jgi:hypothetical protein
MGGTITFRGLPDMVDCRTLGKNLEVATNRGNIYVVRESSTSVRPSMTQSNDVTNDPGNELSVLALLFLQPLQPCSDMTPNLVQCCPL